MLEKLRCLAPLRRPPDRTNDRWRKNLIGEGPALSTKAAPGDNCCATLPDSAYSSHKPRFQDSYPPAISTFYRPAGEPRLDRN